MQRDLFTDTARHIFTVSELTRAVRGAVERAFPSVWVSGEISNFRAPTGGHMYFTLKDASSQIRVVFFKGANRHLKFTPADGMEVVAQGRLSVYEPRGDYQLICEGIEPKGIGALQAAFEELKLRLESEGLFDASRKRPLPVFPSVVGLITSPTGAAMSDFLKTAARRFSGVHVLVHPARVQGASAAAEVIAALGWFNDHRAADVVAIVRGGGSIEDLWPFDEEALCRAIAGSGIPVVTGIGHETDFTLADFAADARALTPTDAARLAVPDAGKLREKILSLRDDAESALSRTLGGLRLELERRTSSLDRSRNIVDEVRQEIEDRAEAMSRSALSIIHRDRGHLSDVMRRASENHPRQRVALARARFLDLSRRMDTSTRVVLRDRRRRLSDSARLLEGLSPLAVLDRGYSLVHDACGRIVLDSETLRAGDNVSLRFARGGADATITLTRK
ncbi:MAG: exodeoxyribonuclease VII large subunit [Deltaproteobacteria bacterium]|nr:exodeoxyribonuclease VII large subunit [Deltaproteobacteria bacterium]